MIIFVPQINLLFFRFVCLHLSAEDVPGKERRRSFSFLRRGSSRKKKRDEERAVAIIQVGNQRLIPFDSFDL